MTIRSDVVFLSWALSIWKGYFKKYNTLKPKSHSGQFSYSYQLFWWGWAVHQCPHHHPLPIWELQCQHRHTLPLQIVVDADSKIYHMSFPFSSYKCFKLYFITKTSSPIFSCIFGKFILINFFRRDIFNSFLKWIFSSYIYKFCVIKIIF